VSGIALGPNFLNRMSASSLVRPVREPSAAFSADLSGEPMAADGAAPGLDSAGEGRFERRIGHESAIPHQYRLGIYTICQRIPRPKR
jgi:hypothetical protein